MNNGMERVVLPEYHIVNTIRRPNARAWNWKPGEWRHGHGEFRSESDNE